MNRNLRWFEAVADCEQRGEPYVLVTVVGVTGSVPREPSSKMVITGEHTWDTIGGGHLEYLVPARAREQLAASRFEVMDLATTLPEHRGSVAILDVLQYLPAEAQSALLRRAAAMLDGDGRLVLRMALADDSRRGRISRIGDRAANWIGWMQFRPRHYPDAASLRALLEQAGLRVSLAPLYGNTPFNNWLLVAHRA